MYFLPKKEVVESTVSTNLKIVDQSGTRTSGDDETFFYTIYRICFSHDCGMEGAYFTICRPVYCCNIQSCESKTGEQNWTFVSFAGRSTVTCLLTNATTSRLSRKLDSVLRGRLYNYRTASVSSEFNGLIRNAKWHYLLLRILSTSETRFLRRWQWMLWP
jgi:hypothetical protein